MLHEKRYWLTQSWHSLRQPLDSKQFSLHKQYVIRSRTNNRARIYELFFMHGSSIHLLVRLFLWHILDALESLRKITHATKHNKNRFGDMVEWNSKNGTFFTPRSYEKYNDGSFCALYAFPNKQWVDKNSKITRQERERARKYSLHAHKKDLRLHWKPKEAWQWIALHRNGTKMRRTLHNRHCRHHHLTTAMIIAVSCFWKKGKSYLNEYKGEYSTLNWKFLR